MQNNSSHIGEQEFRQLQKHLRGGKGRGLGCEVLLVWVSLPPAAGLMVPKGECRQPGRIPAALARPTSPTGSAPGQAHSALAPAQNPHAHLLQHSHSPTLRPSAPWIRSSSTLSAQGAQLCPSPTGMPWPWGPCHPLCLWGDADAPRLPFKGGLGVDPLGQLLLEVWRLQKQREKKKKN